MKKIYKTLGRVCLTAAAFMFIGLGSSKQDVMAKSAKLVSISYKPVKQLTLNAGINGDWKYSKSASTSFFKYDVSDLFENYNNIQKREGDKIILKYSDNTKKVLVAKSIELYQLYYDPLEQYYHSFDTTLAFVNSENDDMNICSRFISKKDYKKDSGAVLDSDEQVYIFKQSEIDNLDILFFRDYEPDDIKVTSTQRYSTRWRGGKTYSFKMKIADKKVRVPVKIKKNTVKKISFKMKKEAVFYEETGGHWYPENGIGNAIHDTSSDEKYEYGYPVDDYIYRKGNKLTITYSNNKKKVYTYSAKKHSFVDKHGKELDYTPEYLFEGNKKHPNGDMTIYFSICFHGKKTTTFKWKIIKNQSISGIQYVPASPITTKELRDDVFRNYYNFDAKKLLYKKGSKLIINYKDGSQKVYTATSSEDLDIDSYFESSDGEKLSFYDISCTTKDGLHWKAGNTYTATIRCMGHKTTVPIKVLPAK